MACSACAAAAANAALLRDQRGQKRISQNNPVGACLITQEMLTVWKSALKCVKSKSKIDKIGLHTSQVNQMAGIIQSALNYPDDYCFYEEQLEYFKTIVLPQIIINVPECINQS